jgi:hypothetical protein
VAIQRFLEPRRPRSRKDIAAVTAIIPARINQSIISQTPNLPDAREITLKFQLEPVCQPNNHCVTGLGVTFCGGDYLNLDCKEIFKGCGFPVTGAPTTRRGGLRRTSRSVKPDLSKVRLTATNVYPEIACPCTHKPDVYQHFRVNQTRRHFFFIVGYVNCNRVYANDQK